MKKTLLILTAILAVGPAVRALADQPVPPDVQELRRDHQADEDDRFPIPNQKPPVFVHKQPVYPSRDVWACAGIAPWQNVYASPDPSSPVIGRTQPQIAVTGDPVNGFFKVLFYNGKLGFVPADEIHAFQEPDRPGVTCTFVGLSGSGRPMFRFYGHLYGQ